MSEFYWSSTTEAFGDFSWAYNVPMDSGSLRIWDKGNIFYVWPVRGGN